jgi:hypothetical protein
MLRNTYGEVLEKESVSLEGKFPDFMLLDPYSYLDIYEIKKPSTRLLKLDKSRNSQSDLTSGELPAPGAAA